jgi:hypothetical protein
MNTEPIPPCGERGCTNPHPAKPWVDRPLRRRLEGEPEKWQPAWLKRLQAKDMTGSLR